MENYQHPQDVRPDDLIVEDIERRFELLSSQIERLYDPGT